MGAVMICGVTMGAVAAPAAIAVVATGTAHDGVLDRRALASTSGVIECTGGAARQGVVAVTRERNTTADSAHGKAIVASARLFERAQVR